jgi:hypothetical protein
MTRDPFMKGNASIVKLSGRRRDFHDGDVAGVAAKQRILYANGVEFREQALEKSGLRKVPPSNFSGGCHTARC